VARGAQTSPYRVTPEVEEIALRSARAVGGQRVAAHGEAGRALAQWGVLTGAVRGIRCQLDPSLGEVQGEKLVVDGAASSEGDEVDGGMESCGHATVATAREVSEPETELAAALVRIDSVNPARPTEVLGTFDSATATDVNRGVSPPSSDGSRLTISPSLRARIKTDSGFASGSNADGDSDPQAPPRTASGRATCSRWLDGCRTADTAPADWLPPASQARQTHAARP